MTALFSPHAMALFLLLTHWWHFLQCEQQHPNWIFDYSQKMVFMKCANICFVLRFNLYEYKKYVFWAFRDTRTETAIEKKSNKIKCTHTPHPYCIGVQAGRQASRLTEIVSEFYMDGVYPIDHDNAYRILTYEKQQIVRRVLELYGWFSFWCQLLLHGPLSEFLHTKCLWHAHT